ncbi:hypothetical protein CEXT_531531 [Caerostris extrusa]|uniref:Uma2 family endonuclease n=1 Tax=Caerostris extrusa TaxID=172846 RepID=A0AAV4XYP2_CAEEX|nr:hypothetical protein CEXT_531531 [Caerostris extrusa]
MVELNALTNEKVTTRVVGDKLKIFPPSAEAHRLIRSEITDKRKLQAHTFLLPQDKQWFKLSFEVYRMIIPQRISSKTFEMNHSMWNTSRNLNKGVVNVTCPSFWLFCQKATIPKISSTLNF